jgi:hypothetical protein
LGGRCDWLLLGLLHGLSHLRLLNVGLVLLVLHLMWLLSGGLWLLLLRDGRHGLHHLLHRLSSHCHLPSRMHHHHKLLLWLLLLDWSGSSRSSSWTWCSRGSARWPGSLGRGLGHHHWHHHHWHL